MVAIHMLRHSMSLATVSRGRDNNFNLLRFGAAGAVILSHSVLLSGNIHSSIAWALGYVAVNCFFIISGFLVCRSLTVRDNLSHYFISRCLRIYPALGVTVLLCVLVSATTLSELDFSDFFRESQTWRFLLNNSLLVVGQVEVYLPGMFTTNPIPGQVNAPLWTLQYEVLMYFWLAAIYLLGRYTASPIIGTISTFLIITLSVVSMTIYLTNISQPQPDTSIAANVVRFAAMFFTGSGFYLLRNRVRLSTSIVALLSILIILSYGIRPLFITLTYLSLTYLLLYLAYVPSGRIRLFNRLGDYSYGLYIFGYPIQQTLVYTWPNIGPAALFVSSLLLALFLAVASWHWIEKPCLSLKPGLPQ